MDYRQLHAFVVLAQELHFGRAAQRLNVTQPALTQQIKNLENTLGLMLFVRDRRNVSLTTEGLFLIDEARVILGHCDKFLENVNSLRLGYKGQLKVGYVGSSILDPALTLLIKNYRHKKSETDLIIEEHNAHNLLTLLLDKRIDLAFVRSPIPQYEQLEYMNIATRSLIAVLPRNHELGNRRKISLALLAKEQFFMQKDPYGVGLGWSAIKACQQAGFTPQKIQYTRDVSVAIGLVSMGMGVALVPETQSSMLMSDVSYCLLEETFATTTLTLCWRRHTKNNILRDFINYTRELTDRQHHRATQSVAAQRSDDL